MSGLIPFRAPLEVLERKDGKLFRYTFAYDGARMVYAIDGVPCVLLACDEAGRLTENRTYRKDGTISEEETYVYDERGLQVRKHSRTGDLTFDTRYAYDENGNCTEQANFMNGIFDGSYTFTRREGSMMQIDRDMDGTVCGGRRIIYTEDGKTRSIVYYRSDGDVDAQTDFTYDAEGRLTEKRTVEEQEVISYRYTYLCEGNTVETREERPDGHIWSKKRSFDDSGLRIKEEHTGRVTEEILHVDGFFVYHSTYAYDEAGRLTETRQYDRDGALLLCVVLTYDGAGTLTAWGEESTAGGVLRLVEVTQWCDLAITPAQAAFLQKQWHKIYSHIPLS